MEKGNKAVAEGVSEDKYEVKKYEAPGITVFELSDDKIRHIRFFYDKLSIIKQVAMQYTGVTEWFTKRLVNSIVKHALHGFRGDVYALLELYTFYCLCFFSFSIWRKTSTFLLT